jgi:hypothetical protein
MRPWLVCLVGSPIPELGQLADRLVPISNGAMVDDQLEHLERIYRCSEAIGTLPWVDSDEQQRITSILMDFDSAYWTFVKYLSTALYAELEQLLLHSDAPARLLQRPEIVVVLPVHEASADLLERAVWSTSLQVGVSIDCRISIDGRQEDRELAETILQKMNPNPGLWAVSVQFSPTNQGVGMCRNRVLKGITAPFFTCIDADDLFHPLRCLHGLLVMADRGLERVNTGYSRVSMQQGKIIMINGRLSWTGHNSFIAKSSLLERYGYLADLRYHEDTEYMNRLAFFGVPMLHSAPVGHYLNSEADWGYVSLSTPVRREVHPIEGHPYLAGSVIAELTPDRIEMEERFAGLYQSVISEGLRHAFPPE